MIKKRVKEYKNKLISGNISTLTNTCPHNIYIDMRCKSLFIYLTPGSNVNLSQYRTSSSGAFVIKLNKYNKAQRNEM